MRILTLSIVLGLSSVSPALVGCSLGSSTAQTSLPLNSQAPTTPIAMLLAQPMPAVASDLTQGPETGEVYTLVGEVQQVVPLVGGQMYELGDSSGRIWVLSEMEVLAVGDRVLLEGVLIYERIPLADREQGEYYVIEQQQLEVQVAQPSAVP
ncbi:MAG: hypothetical protein ACO4AI_14320 [Prochlorothrix sp.]|nr:hypothetical protein [Prochlorothrix sp.]